MVRFISFVLFVAAGYVLLEPLGLGPSGLRIDGSQVVLETEDFEVHFTRLGASETGTHMVFGGLNDQLRNNLSHATLATLAIRHAQLIGETHPDFHLCSSPGAAQAKRLVETWSFVAASRSARAALIRAVDLHAERLRGDGTRTCVDVTGAELLLDAVQLKHDGRDITSDVAPAFRNTRFQLAERAELADCESLLR
ncbi:MAG: hypothetical protein JSU66_17165 [Deltaproteobacteria bacterium]|nr:MAG: hypothetical protein JSU66_17165 [Deltaproteobacteria bacterium]